MLPKAKCIPCGCPLAKSDVPTLASQQPFTLRGKTNLAWYILSLQTFYKWCLWPTTSCNVEEQVSTECTAEITGCCENELLHSSTTTFTRKDSAFATMMMLKVKTSLYSAEVYSGYNYTTMQHTTNFPTMQRWGKHTRLTGWDMPSYYF